MDRGFSVASAFLVTLLFVFFSVQIRSASLPSLPGAIDPTFGSAGFTTTNLGEDSDSLARANAVVIQPDGKIVVAGQINPGNSEFSDDNFILTRLHSDGSVDTSFGDQGIAITDFFDEDSALALAMQSDGKIVVAGCQDSILACNGAVMARYTAQGILDPTFGQDGKVRLADADYFAGVTVRADGKIVLAGSNGDSVVVARLSSDGALDPAFGSQGVAHTKLTGSEKITGLEIVSDGRIVLSGYAYPNCLLIRFQEDGALDSGFGSGGVVKTGHGDDCQWSSLVIQPDGKVVSAGGQIRYIAGTSVTEIILGRYLVNGNLDTSFGAGGIVTTSQPEAARARAILRQSDGSLTIAGTGDFLAIRYRPDGSLDPAFGVGGIVAPTYSANSSYFPASNAFAGIAGSDAGCVVIVGYITGYTHDLGVVQLQANGSLDPAFGQAGMALLPEDDYATANVLALQADGRVVAAGSTGSYSYPIFTVSRHLANGLPDATFGSEGVVTSDVNGQARARAVLVQADGKAILGGSGLVLHQADNGLVYDAPSFALARYESNGALDWSFGAQGKATALIGESAHIWDMAFQSDGKIVAAGESKEKYVTRAAIARFLPNGALDSTFGSGGVITTPLGIRFVVYGLAVQSDGRLLVAGCSQDSGSTDQFILARYTPAGLLDGSFGSGGIVRQEMGKWGSCAFDVALQSDGKIVAVGRRLDPSRSPVALRVLPNGSLDSTFGAGGVVVIPLEPFSERALGATAYAVALQPDGKILIGGQVAGLPSGLAMARLKANGEMDPAFGGDGAISHPIVDSADSRINSLVLQPDGKIVAVGAEDASETLVVLRVDSAGSLDPSFGAGGVVSATILGVYTKGFAVAVLPDGKIIAAGETAYKNGPYLSTVSWMSALRLRADGSLDAAFGSGGRIATPFGGKGTATDVVAQGDGKLLAASGRMVARYLADGHMDLSFGMNGRIIPDFDPSFLALLPDGKFLAAGNRFNDVVIARYWADGTSDLTFGSAGQVVGQAGAVLYIRTLLVQKDDKILVVGDAEFEHQKRLVVLRFSVSGAPDNTYGAAGVVLSPAELDVTVHAALLKPDTKLLVAASGGVLFQFDPSGQLDPAFGKEGWTGFQGTFVYALGLTADGQIVGAGTKQAQPSNRSIDLVRMDTSGRLDPTFSLDGNHETNIRGVANGMLVRPDGRLLVAAEANAFQRPGRYAIVSFSSAGELDNSFGVPSGWSRVPVQIGSAESVMDLVALPDGKLLATAYRSTLIRYTANGIVDTSFGEYGTATVRGVLSGLAVQTDGRFLITVRTSCGSARWVWPPPECSRLDMHRYLADGSLDPGFGASGVVTGTLGGDHNAILLQPDGKIVVVRLNLDEYSTYRTLSMARYHLNGQPDPSFGNQGQVVAPILIGYAATLQPNGKILVAGAGDSFAIARFTQNGVLDSSFGVDGVAETEFGSFGTDRAFAVAVQPDGKLLLAGYHRDGSGSNSFAMARFDGSGVLDAAFGQQGRVLTDFPSPATVRALLLEADGKILAIGQSGEAIAVARYHPDGRVDDSFGQYGRMTTRFGAFPSAVHAAVFQSSQKVVVGGHAFTGRDNDLALLRFQVGSPASTATPTLTPTGGTPAPPTTTPTVTPTATDTPPAPVSKCGLVPGASTHLCVAYIYGSNLADAEDFRLFLEGEGFQVNLVSEYAASTYNYTTDWAILVGADTDISPETADYLLHTSLPVVTIGRGGYLFFYSQGLLSQGRYEVYSEPPAVISTGGSFHGPDVTDFGRTCIGHLCSFPYRLMGGVYPNAFVVDVYQSESAVRGQVWNADPAQWAGAYHQLWGDVPGSGWLTIFPDCYAYWHFDGPPSGMTTEGKKLFINTLYRNACQRSGLDPAIGDFRARGLGASYPIPETGNLVELEADVQVPKGFELEACFWTGLPVPDSENSTEDMCRYVYRPKAGAGPSRSTYGPQRTTLTVTYRHQETGITNRLDKELEFNVFFSRDGNDDKDKDTLPNWFEYWGADGAVPGLLGSDVTHDPSISDEYGRYCPPGTTGCASKYHDKIVLGSLAATDDTSLTVAKSTFCPGLQLPAVQGIDVCARTISHEAKHKEIYQKDDQSGICKAEPDSDCSGRFCDGLCDKYESTVSGTNIHDVDSCDLEKAIHPDYAEYGDNELVARQAEKGVWGNPAKDWANPGKQVPQSGAAVDRAQTESLSPQRSGPVLDGSGERRSTFFVPLVMAGDPNQPLQSRLVEAELSPGPAILLGRYQDAGVDANNDGLWESLRLGVDVQINESRSYNLVAWLANQSGSDFAWASTAGELATGEHTVDLIFDGLLVWGAASDGPYRVSRVELRRSVDARTMDAAEQVYTTAVYSRASFTPPAIALAGDFANSMLDTDSDQMINTLRFDVGLDVYTRGVYTITGELHGSQGYIGATSATGILDVGQRSVLLDFPGESVYFVHFSGPLSLQGVRVEDAAGRIWDWRTDAAITASYTVFDFQHDQTTLRITSGFSDRAIDSDGDGKYDWLEIDVQVYSGQRAVYWVSGELVDASSAAHTSAMQPLALESGVVTTATLAFPGPAVYRLGVNGTLRVESLAIRSSNGTLLVYRPFAHYTQSYNYADFVNQNEEIYLPIILDQQ